jgi:hypothetical protein
LRKEKSTNEFHALHKAAPAITPVKKNQREEAKGAGSAFRGLLSSNDTLFGRLTGCSKITRVFVKHKAISGLYPKNTDELPLPHTIHNALGDSSAKKQSNKPSIHTDLKNSSPCSSPFNLMSNNSKVSPSKRFVICSTD